MDKSYYFRKLVIYSPNGEIEVLNFLKSLSDWEYVQENIDGTRQEVLRHKNKDIEIYIRTGFYQNAYMTSNTFPQDMLENQPLSFEEDALYVLYTDIINKIKSYYVEVQCKVIPSEYDKNKM